MVLLDRLRQVKQEFSRSYSPYQFAAFRIVLGLYLTWHFVKLVPYGAEVWSREGMLPDANLLPTRVFPNVLNHLLTSPAEVTAFLVLLAAFSVCFTLGFFRRVASVLLWYGWACLLNRNIFIANPSLPFVGWILLACALIPEGDPFSMSKRRRSSPLRMNAIVFAGAWVIMAVGYTISGIHKATAQSWRDGSALLHVLNLPMARDNTLRALLVQIPAIVKLMTWGALTLEILFAPLCLIRVLRPWVFLAMIGLHLGILGVVSMTDLTGGMLMVHLFMIDPRWFPPRTAGQPIVFFDGVCVFCDASVSWLLFEDRHRVYRVATLQGATARDRLGPAMASDMSTVILLAGDKVYRRSEAALRVVSGLGGIWRAASLLLWVPARLRDIGYDWFARNRYRWFGKRETCRVPTPEERAVFLD